MKRRIVHIVVAAGSGSRYGGGLPKQFLPMQDGRPVLMTTLDCFMSRREEEVLLVISREMEELWLELCEQHRFCSPQIVYGGKTRHGSVANALKTLGEMGPEDIITVHDGARPIVTSRLIDRLLAPLLTGTSRAVIPVVDVTDSLRMINTDGTTQSVDRTRFRAVQTPQAFIATLLIKAYAADETPQMTDEASVIEIAGMGKIDTIPGDPHNIKITRPGDIEIARLYLSKSVVE
ncbi:MAG: 2-C-methyl-D-erythritol 4-phosphate cytidylyltransferase [Muribaculaceae bacterium]|nr:2-C-methyl-D-erythritol 4-phosphate cytidylyltransferase [Muribaculaceae bacterium]